MISFDLGDPALASRFVERDPDLRPGRIARRRREPGRPPGAMTHASVPPAMRQAMGLTDSLVRLSCGVEDAEDLIGGPRSGFVASRETQIRHGRSFHT